MEIRRKLNLKRRRLALPAVALVVVFSASLYFASFHLESEKSQQDEYVPTFIQSVAARASPSRDILIVYVDFAFVDMALNFHGMSLKRHHITNFLFVSSDHACCHRLREASLPCHVHKSDRAAGLASQHGSRDFVRKMNYRTDVILMALEYGYTVLHTDTDVVFLRNPFDYLRPLTCDIAIMMEKPALFNAGFVYVRPTRDGIDIYRRMRTVAEKSQLVDDQTQLNAVLKSLEPTIQVIALPMSLFASGRLYFEKSARVFAADPRVHTDHYVIHNNWIVAKEAKVYRFKEHLMWTLDDGEYYSSKTRRYLAYDNPPLTSGSLPSVSAQLGALRSALAIGRTLSRTVILPAFHYHGTRTSALNSLLRVSSFDAVFRDEYREHVFLRHPKVPQSVKKSRSKTVLIVSEAADAVLPLGNKKRPILFRPSNRTAGANSLEIATWFRGVNEAVLCFQSLYGAFGSFADKNEQAEFEKRISAAFRPAGYRQYM